MPRSSSNTGTPQVITALTLIVAVSLCFGIYARFIGLGKWPLAIDEYYLAQSVQNVLHVGLPEYACGGFYTRGLLLQYSAALLQLAGLSPELAPRFIAAVSSLIALPAIYILGSRAGGRVIGLIAVAIMGISVWEIEMARLGRMYAPFQALFVWYLVFFFSYTLDRRKRALAPMLALSVIGVLVWEGGVFLAITNLLPPLIRNPSGRLQRRDWLYLAAVALLAVPVYWFVTADLRTLSADAALPPDYQSFDTPSLSPLDAGIAPWRTLFWHRGWALVALLPLAATLYAAYGIVRRRLAPTATIGLLTALACALFQQFELAGAIVLVLLLLSMVEWQQLSTRSAPALQAALAACAIFWIAFGLGTHDWHAEALPGLRGGALLGYEFVRFPDFVREVAIPWARTVPVLGSAIFALLALACGRTIMRSGTTSSSERLLIALLICLLLAASASRPPRHETRYVFFLYPLAIIVALNMLDRGTRALLGGFRYASAVLALLAFGGFALTEDFRAAHLWNIDSAAVNFRIGMNEHEIAHYHPRTDIRAAARWLASNAVSGRDVVVSSFPGLDFYYPNERFFFMESTDVRYEGWACRAGTQERWGNRPLITSVAALASQVSFGRTVWLVIEPRRMVDLAARLAQTAPAVRVQSEWTTAGRDVTVVALRRFSGTG